MSYRKIIISTPKDERIGYLSNGTDWTLQEAVISDLDRAYGYKKVPVDGGLRLDQLTDGGDRSLTYSSNGGYPCWGLASNWVVLTFGEDQSISFDKGSDGIRYLGRGPFNQGPQWSSSLLWLPESQFAYSNFQKLKFTFDES